MNEAKVDKLRFRPLIQVALACVFCFVLGATFVLADSDEANRQTVLQTPHLVAFWDFVQREPDGQHRFTAHVPSNSPTDYPLDAANYVKDYWGEGREATYDDFPLLGRGPFRASDSYPQRKGCNVSAVLVHSSLATARHAAGHQGRWGIGDRRRVGDSRKWQSRTRGYLA